MHPFLISYNLREMEQTLTEMVFPMVVLILTGYTTLVEVFTWSKSFRLRYFQAVPVWLVRIFSILH